MRENHQDACRFVLLCVQKYQSLINTVHFVTANINYFSRSTCMCMLVKKR